MSPGEGDDLDVMYSSERSEEVRTLCDPQVQAAITAEGIELRSTTRLVSLGPRLNMRSGSGIVNKVSALIGDRLAHLP